MSVHATFYVVAGKSFDEITDDNEQGAEKFGLEVHYSEPMGSSKGVIGFKLFSDRAWDEGGDPGNPIPIYLSEE